MVQKLEKLEMISDKEVEDIGFIPDPKEIKVEFSSSFQHKGVPCD